MMFGSYKSQEMSINQIIDVKQPAKLYAILYMQRFLERYPRCHDHLKNVKCHVVMISE